MLKVKETERIIADYDTFVAPATTTGRNIAPCVAAPHDVMRVSDIPSTQGPRTFTRPNYADNAIATVESSDAKWWQRRHRRRARQWRQRPQHLRQRQDHRFGRPGIEGRCHLRCCHHPAGQQAEAGIGTIRAAGAGSLHRRRHLRRDPAPSGLMDSDHYRHLQKRGVQSFQVADIGLVGDLLAMVPDLPGKL